MATSKKEKSMADRSATFVSTATSEREKAIEQALNQIERRFGKGAIMKLGEISRIHVDVIPTGSIALDLALVSAVYLEVVLPRFMVLKLPVKLPSVNILSPVHNMPGGMRHSLMPSTRSIARMQPVVVLTSITCSSLNRIPVSRRSRLMSIPQRAAYVRTSACSASMNAAY